MAQLWQCLEKNIVISEGDKDKEKVIYLSICDTGPQNQPYGYIF